MKRLAKAAAPAISCVLVIACDPTKSPKQAPAATASAPAASTSAATLVAPTDAGGEPYAFECTDGKVALGLGLGGTYRHSLAWESTAPGTSNAAAAPGLCSRMNAVETCVEQEKRRQDGGSVGTVDLLLTIAHGGGLTVEGEPARPQVAPCVAAALAGAPFGGEGKLRYRYIVDVARGRLGQERQAHRPAVTETVTGTGALPLDIVKRVVRTSLPRVRECYEAALAKSPAAAGTVVVSLAIDGSGAPRAKWESGTLADATARTCIVDALGRVKFPGSSARTNAVASFELHPSE